MPISGDTAFKIREAFAAIRDYSSADGIDDEKSSEIFQKIKDLNQSVNEHISDLSNRDIRSIKYELQAMQGQMETFVPEASNIFTRIIGGEGKLRKAYNLIGGCLSQSIHPREQRETELAETLKSQLKEQISQSVQFLEKGESPLEKDYITDLCINSLAENILRSSNDLAPDEQLVHLKEKLSDQNEVIRSFKDVMLSKAKALGGDSSHFIGGLVTLFIKNEWMDEAREVLELSESRGMPISAYVRKADVEAVSMENSGEITESIAIEVFNKIKYQSREGKGFFVSREGPEGVEIGEYQKKTSLLGALRTKKPAGVTFDKEEFKAAHPEHGKRYLEGGTCSARSLYFLKHFMDSGGSAKSLESALESAKKIEAEDPQFFRSVQYGFNTIQVKPGKLGKRILYNLRGNKSDDESLQSPRFKKDKVKSLANYFDLKVTSSSETIKLLSLWDLLEEDNLPPDVSLEDTGGFSASTFTKMDEGAFHREVNKLKDGAYLLRFRANSGEHSTSHQKGKGENYGHSLAYVKQGDRGFLYDPNLGLKVATGEQGAEMLRHVKDATMHRFKFDEATFYKVT